MRVLFGTVPKDDNELLDRYVEANFVIETFAIAIANKIGVMLFGEGDGNE